MNFVTGGTGLLGSHLLLSLAREERILVAMKRAASDLEGVRQVFRYHEAENLFERIKWVDADIMNPVDMQQVIKGAERVWHCAAMVSFHPRQRQEMISFNTESTANVVNACLENGVKKLLHVSSTSAIGTPPDDTPATELHTWSRSRSSTGYAESKFRSEMEVWRGMEEGLNGVIVNPAIILGSGFWTRGSSAMFSRVAGGMKYAAPGITGFVGATDVVQAMCSLMDSDISGERFILSEGSYSYEQVFQMIGRALGVPRKLKLATPSLMRTMARLDALAGLFTGKRLITSDQIGAAFGESHFSAEKIRENIGMEFTPLEKVIAEVAASYRADHP
jgi:dihydroflavonol-4-reductase